MHQEIYKLRDDYSKWLTDQEWDYFFTGTFRWRASMDSARRAGERFFSEYDYSLVTLFIETGKETGDVHLHGLLKFSPLNDLLSDTPYDIPSANGIWNRWFKRYGRSKVETIRSQEAVSKYCAKYVTKHLGNESFIVLT